MTLLDLSSEPVASSREPCEKSMEEFEPEERDEFGMISLDLFQFRIHKTSLSLVVI